MTVSGKIEEVQLQYLRNQLGIRIQRLREERGWSQDTLAHLVGLGRSYPHKIEKGKVDVQFSTLARIAFAFRVSIASLVIEIDDDDQKRLAGEPRDLK